MLKWVNKQKIESTEGWSFGSKNRFYFKYISENNNNYTVAAEAFYANKTYTGESIFFDTLKPDDPNLAFSDLQKELVKTRIRKALNFMGIVYKESSTEQNNLTQDYAVRRRNALVLEEIFAFSSQEEFKCFEEFIDKQIKKGFLEEMAIDFNYNFKNRTGGRWFKEELTNQHWRLIEPSNSFKGCWELVRKKLLKE